MQALLFTILMSTAAPGQPASEWTTGDQGVQKEGAEEAWTKKIRGSTLTYRNSANAPTFLRKLNTSPISRYYMALQASPLYWLNDSFYLSAQAQLLGFVPIPQGYADGDELSFASQRSRPSEYGYLWFDDLTVAAGALNVATLGENINLLPSLALTLPTSPDSLRSGMLASASASAEFRASLKVMKGLALSLSPGLSGYLYSHNTIQKRTLSIADQCAVNSEQCVDAVGSGQRAPMFGLSLSARAHLKILDKVSAFAALSYQNRHLRGLSDVPEETELMPNPIGNTNWQHYVFATVGARYTLHKVVTLGLSVASFHRAQAPSQSLYVPLINRNASVRLDAIMPLDALIDAL